MAQTPANVTVDIMLEKMMEMQAELQRRYLSGFNPQHLPEVQRMDYVRTIHTAIIKELGEVMDECGWKPWASSNHINEEAFKAELVDVFHFFMNFMLVVGMTPAELYAGYMRKNGKNHARIDGDYDGVTGKCPACHRDYADPGVTCRPKWCQVYGVLPGDNQIPNPGGMLPDGEIEGMR